MGTSGPYRWAGYAGVVGAALLILGEWIHPKELAEASRTTWELSHELIFCGVVLIVAALFALYGRQSRSTATWGFVGFVLAFIGAMGFSGLIWYEAFIAPALAGDPAALAAVKRLESGEMPSALTGVFLISAVAFALGWLLFGLSTARAGVLSRTAAYVALVGGVLVGLAPLVAPGNQAVDRIAGTIFGVGLAWLAWGLTTERKTMTAAALP